MTIFLDAIRQLIFEQKMYAKKEDIILGVNKLSFYSHKSHCTKTLKINMIIIINISTNDFQPQSISNFFVDIQSYVLIQYRNSKEYEMTSLLLKEL